MTLADNPRIPTGALLDPFAAPSTATGPSGSVPAGAVPAGAVSAPPPPPPPPAPEEPELSYEHKVGALVRTAKGNGVVLGTGPVHRVINGQEYVIPGYVVGHFADVNDNPSTADDLGIETSS